jgi:hypothetical protein
LLWPPTCHIEQQRQKEGKHIITHTPSARSRPDFFPRREQAKNLAALDYDVRLASKVMIPKAASESIPANPIRG